MKIQSGRNHKIDLSFECKALVLLWLNLRTTEVNTNFLVYFYSNSVQSTSPEWFLTHSRFSWITQIWYFCTKLASRCLKKIKFPPVGIDADPTVLRRNLLTVSDFRILVKSCSIESRNDPSPKSDVVHETKFLFITHISGWHSWISVRLLNQWWSVVSLIPIGGNFIFCCNLLKPLDVILYVWENYLQVKRYQNDSK